MNRLLDDPQLPRELRDDLQRSRTAGHAYDTAAKLGALRSAISDPTRIPTGADPSGGASVGKAVSWYATPGAWKLAVLLAVGGGAGLVAWGARTPTDARPVPTAVAPAARAPEAAQPSPAREPLPRAPDLEAAGSVSPVESTSRREIAQIVRIRALLEHDPAAAYALSLQAAEEFPDGLLAEEREALQVLALWRKGDRAVARRRARAFLARHPQSPMRDRVAAVLKR